MVSDSFDIDEATQVELFRSEHRHDGHERLYQAQRPERRRCHERLGASNRI